MNPTAELVHGRRTYDHTERGPGIHDICLTVNPGESIAIVGPSGAGKSTVLNILGLLDTLDAGSLRISGEEVSGAPRRRLDALRRNTIGFVFQSYHLLPHRTALDNVLLPLRLQRVPHRVAHSRAMDELERLGLGPVATKKARFLSGGEQQRVALARAVVANPRLLLADEPTGNLDSANGELVLSAMKLVAQERQAALIIVTHDEDIAHSMNRTVRVESGVIVDETEAPPIAVAIATRVAHSGHDLRVQDPTPHTRTDAAIQQESTRRIGFTTLALEAIRTLGSRLGVATALVVLTALAAGSVCAAMIIGASAQSHLADIFSEEQGREVVADLSLDSLSPDAPREFASVESLPLAKTSKLVGVERVGSLSIWGSAVVTKSDMLKVKARIVEVDDQALDLVGAEVTWTTPRVAPLSEGDVLLGASIARELGVAQLDVVQEVSIAGTSYRVVGVLQESRDVSLVGSVIGFRTAGFRTPIDATIPSKGRVILQTSRGSARQVGHNLTAVLDPFGDHGLSVRGLPSVSATSDSITTSSANSFRLLALVVAIAGFSLVAIANTVSLIYRRVEIGLRRALGYGGADVAAHLCIEAAVVGFVGGAVGVLLGLTVGLVVTHSNHWPPVLDWQTLVVAVVGGTVATVAASAGSVLAARRIDPAQVLRSA